MDYSDMFPYLFLLSRTYSGACAIHMACTNAVSITMHCLCWKYKGKSSFLTWWAPTSHMLTLGFEPRTHWCKVSALPTPNRGPLYILMETFNVPNTILVPLPLSKFHATLLRAVFGSLPCMIHTAWTQTLCWCIIFWFLYLLNFYNSVTMRVLSLFLVSLLHERKCLV